MALHLTSDAVASFFQSGFVILRDAIPVTLVADLRRECEKAAAAVRASHGWQSQRFQPLSRYVPPMDERPWRDYGELPELNDAFRRMLGPDVFYGRLDVAGVFIEPKERPWSAVWHRDITRASSRFETDEEFAEFALDWDSLNQINAALYDDSCTWYVPGSHLRPIDTPAEEAVAAWIGSEEFKKYDHADPAITEKHLREACRRMPGAAQVHLHAGDVLLYRAIGWHCGNYVPYRKRATILDVLYSPAYYAWRHPWLAGESPKWKPERKREGAAC
jgi:hypothetical protein